MFVRLTRNKMVHSVADLADFNNQLAEAGDKLVVIDFHATWCGPCKQIAPYFAELSSEFTDVVFLKIDVEEAEDVANIYDVSSIPKFVFVKNKEKIGEMLGADREKLKEMVTQHK